MEDAALAVLRANAERLMRNGTAVQQSAAAALMPSIEAELDARNAAKLSRKADALAARRTAKALKTGQPAVRPQPENGQE